MENDAPEGSESLTIDQAAAAYTKATETAVETDHVEPDAEAQSDDTTDEGLQAEESAGQDDDGEPLPSTAARRQTTAISSTTATIRPAKLDCEYERSNPTQIPVSPTAAASELRRESPRTTITRASTIATIRKRP